MTPPLSKHWGLEIGMEADISQTHPPSRIKVAFSQRFVIISIRIREGPLRHDARNEPAEQGKKRIYVEIRAKAALRRRRPAPGEHLLSSPSATARSWRFEWTPGPQRPSRQGVAPPQKGCQGSQPTATKGFRSAPHVRTLGISSKCPCKVPKPCMEKDMATHSNALTWRVPWTEEPGGLQSMGLQRVGYARSHEDLFCTVLLCILSTSS